MRVVRHNGCREAFHESFATYAEGLFAECEQGRKACAEFTIGERQRIKNDKPIVGAFGVNNEGSDDMYSKGGNMLHTIRQVVNDDVRWRRLLRALNKTFWHQTVSGTQVEDYISSHSGLKLDKVFDQYLRTTKIPTLEYKLEASRLSYRWSNVVPEFAMPVKVTTAPGLYTWIRPTERWKTTRVKLDRSDEFHVDENFYVVVKDLLKWGLDSTAMRKDQ